jgi:hypothetical protein
VKWYVADTVCRYGAVQQVLRCHIAKLSLVLGTEACVRACVCVKGVLCTERGVTDANTRPNPDTQFLVIHLSVHINENQHSCPFLLSVSVRVNE